MLRYDSTIMPATVSKKSASIPMIRVIGVPRMSSFGRHAMESMPKNIFENFDIQTNILPIFGFFSSNQPDKLSFWLVNVYINNGIRV